MRGIDGGKGRSDTEVADNLDDEDTVVGVPDFVLQQTDEANAERLLDDAAVEGALGQIVDPRGEMPSLVAPPPPQPFMPPANFAPKTAPLPTVAPPRRFSTTAPMPTVAPPFPVIPPMPIVAPQFPAIPPMPTVAPPFPAIAPMPTAIPAVPTTAPIPRSLPLSGDMEGRSTRFALLLFALISILCGGVGLGWFLLTGPRDEPTTQPPPAAPPTPRVVPRHTVGPAPPTSTHHGAAKQSSR